MTPHIDEEPTVSQRRGAVRVLALLAFFFAVLGLDATGQQTGPRLPPLIISSTYGRDLFEFYCATCHGRDARGGGPAAAALRTPPPDLTMTAARNGGVFPKTRVEALVAGERDLPAHGSREMPVWGPIFGALDQNDRMNRVRLANIVDYIASIQTK
jgi:hypothetical protein